jgi:hypothetical protein
MESSRRPSARPETVDRSHVRKTLGLVVGAMFVAAGLVWAGCVADEGRRSSDLTSDHGPDALLAGGSWIATARVGVIAVYAGPSDDHPIRRLPSPDENGTPLVFLVDGPDASGAWLPVYLPLRPNGTKGWVRSRDVDLAQTQMHIEVELSAHRLTVRRNREVVIESAIGVGKDSTPTPGGGFYVKELIQPPSPDTVYGPYVFGLSGFSDVVRSFAGDPDARIAIHGNNDPGSIGRNVSHGCIRLPNDVITRMTELIPLGTPVEIRA